MRKHIERAAHDIKAVITTYEGKHNHDVPAARGSGSYSMNGPASLNINNNTVPAAVPIRPSAVSTSSFANSLHNTTTRAPPTSASQEPFLLEMLQSPVSNFRYPDSGSYNNHHAQFSDAGAYTKAKDERKEDSFFQSFMSKNF